MHKGSFTVKTFGHKFRVVFNEETRITTATITVKQKCNQCGGQKCLKFIGMATCNKEDKFIVKYGASLAIKRSLLSYKEKAISFLSNALKASRNEREQMKHIMNTRLEKTLKEAMRSVNCCIKSKVRDCTGLPANYGKVIEYNNSRVKIFIDTEISEITDEIWEGTIDEYYKYWDCD